MARRLPRSLVPIAVTLLALVLAFWAMKPSLANETPPPAPAPTTEAPQFDTPRPPKQPGMSADAPNGPKDCADCVQTDPA